MQKPHATALLLVLTIPCASRADSIAADFTGGPTTIGHGGNSSTTLGWTFTAESAVRVAALGYFDEAGDGLAEAHEVGIFDAGGTLLVSATVPSGAGGSLADGFRYVAIAPFVLSAGTYTIGGAIGAAASDPVAYNVSGLASASPITIPTGAGRYTEAGAYTSLSFPDLVYPPQAPYDGYFGPNFQFTAVPEPSGLALLALGAAGGLGLRWRRRAADV
ncbi:MAG: hypothetical protein BGO49_14565 [Planctomycetales bacterium 71-10]|nr:MAG: hypothetical protein BGO49_14565 [Planctomycetales bacterium 71-10]